MQPDKLHRHYVYCRYMPKIHLYTTLHTRRTHTRRYLRNTNARSSTNIASSNNTIGADTASGHQRFVRHIHYDRGLDDGWMPDTEGESLTPCKARRDDDGPDGVVRRCRAEEGRGGVEFEGCGWERVGVEDLEQWLRMRLSVGRGSCVDKHE